MVTLLAAGRPVVAAVNAQSEVARVFTEAGAGVVVPPEAPKPLVEAIQALRRDTTGRHASGAGVRASARQQWDREQILPAFEARLLGLAGHAKMLGRGVGPAPGQA